MKRPLLWAVVALLCFWALLASMCARSFAQGCVNPLCEDDPWTWEQMQDHTAALIQPGPGITWEYDDALGTLTPTVEPGLALGDVDRLTTQDASPSTMILSDNDADQTLTENLGWLDFVLAGRDAGSGVTEKRLSLGQDTFLGAPFYHAAFGAPAYGFVRQDPGAPTTHLQHMGQVDFGGGPGPFLDMIAMLDLAGSSVGQAFAVIGSGGTPYVWLSDENAATAVLGGYTQFLLTSNSGQFVDLAPRNNIALGGAAHSFVAVLDGPGTGVADSLGMSIDVTATPVTGGGDDYVGSNFLLSQKNSALDIVQSTGARFYNLVADTYSGDITRLTAGTFLPYVEAGYGGTLAAAYGCLVDPFLYQTVPSLVGYGYTRDHIGSAPTLEYASRFDGDSLWEDNRSLFRGTDRNIGDYYDPDDNVLKWDDLAGNSAQHGRGTSDPDTTFLALRNEAGTLCYLYPDAAGTGITVSASRP